MTSIDPDSEYWRDIVKRWERACVDGDMAEVENLIAVNSLKYMYSATPIRPAALLNTVYGSIEHDPQPLHLACKYGQAKVVKRLLDEGLDPYKDSSIYRSIFAVLCTIPTGWEGVLCGATQSDNDGASREKLNWVLETGRPQVAKVLVDWGIDVNHTKKGFSQLPLVMLARSGLTEIAKVFLDAGADPMRTSGPSTKMDAAFTAASTGGSLPVLKEILARGYPLNHQAERSETLLHAACDVDNREVIQYLLSAGLGVNQPNIDGITPLHYASGKRTTLAAFLLKRGADVHAVDCHGRTALHDACSSGSLVSFNALVAAGADIHAVDKYQETPLTCACLRGRYDIVRSLLDLGVDPAMHEQGDFVTVEHPPLMQRVIRSITARPQDKAQTLGVLMQAQGLSPLDEIYGKSLMEHVRSEVFWAPNSGFNGSAAEYGLAVQHVEDLQRACRAELLSSSLERAMSRDDEDDQPSGGSSHSSGPSL